MRRATAWAFVIVATVAATGGGAFVAHQMWARNRPVSAGLVTGISGGDEIIDFRKLGAFDLPPNATDADIPQPNRNLDGHRVQVAGYIYAPNTADDEISSFQFLYTVVTDGHHSPPRAQDRIFATVAGGRKVSNPGMYMLVTLGGILRVGIRRDSSGDIVSVYRMDVDRVTPSK